MTFIILQNNISRSYLYFRNLSLILGTIIVFISFLLSSNNFNNISGYNFEKEYTKEINKYNTTVKIYSKSENKANKVLNDIEKIYNEYFELADRNNKESELYKLNDMKFGNNTGYWNEI